MKMKSPMYLFYCSVFLLYSTVAASEYSRHHEKMLPMLRNMFVQKNNVKPVDKQYDSGSPELSAGNLRSNVFGLSRTSEDDAVAMPAMSQPEKIMSIERMASMHSMSSQHPSEAIQNPGTQVHLNAQRVEDSLRFK